ncbi:MAG: hypothetical protein NT151_09510 [Acidobacteria bacterium]|nr:hypothetical protein [Acidobacteriota bacterium]
MRIRPSLTASGLTPRPTLPLGNGPFGLRPRGASIDTLQDQGKPVPLRGDLQAPEPLDSTLEQEQVLMQATELAQALEAMDASGQQNTPEYEDLTRRLQVLVGQQS